jgi:hypothetical protein
MIIKTVHSNFAVLGGRTRRVYGLFARHEDAWRLEKKLRLRAKLSRRAYVQKKVSTV